MRLVADLMLMAGALGAALYCLILSRRLQKLASLDSGLGQAIAVLSAQVADMSRALEVAKSTAQTARGDLERATAQAKDSTRKLELLLASLHDLPDTRQDQTVEFSTQNGRSPPDPLARSSRNLFKTPVQNQRRERVP